MDTRRWFEVPAADIPLRPDSHELGQQLRWRSSRWRSSRDSLWSVHDRQVAIFDRGDAPMRKVVGTGKYHPAVDRIPWDARWKPPSTAGGNLDQLCYIDTPEGWRYGLWMPSYPAKILWGLWRLGGTVGAGAAWVCSSPAVDGKGRVVPGDPADLRTYRGNDPRCNGAGVIPRPLTRAQLDAGRIGHALSAVVANDTFGPAGLVCAPAGKIEGGPGSMSVGGVRFAWRYADGDLDDLIGALAPEYRWGVTAICEAMREYGATVDITGPNAGIVCADVGLPRDALAGIVDRVEWVVCEPPVGYRGGQAVDTGPGWYDDITYEPC